MENTLKCRNCGAELKPNWKICPECETPVGLPKCKNCGMELKEHWKACPECGTPVGDKKAVEAQESDKKAISSTPIEASDNDRICEDLKKKLEEEYIGNIEGAIREVNKWIKKYPSNFLLLLIRAELFEENEEYQYAIQDYTELLRSKLFLETAIAEDYAYVYMQRGCVYNEIEEYDKAVADMNEAIRLDPNNAEYFFKRGDLCNDYNAKLSDFSRAIELDSGNANYLLRRGILLFHSEEFDKAICDFTNAVKLDLNNFNAYNWRGDAYRKQRHYDRAITDYTKLIEIDASFTFPFYLRGQCYEETGNPDAALSEYSKAIEHDSNYATPLSARGILYFKLGKYATALEDFTKAIVVHGERLEKGTREVDDEGLADCYYWRGSTYTWLDKFDKAKVDFKEAVRLAPDNEEYRKALEKIK